MSKSATTQERRENIHQRLHSEDCIDLAMASGLYNTGRFSGVCPVDTEELRYTMFPNDLMTLLPLMGDAAWRVLCVIVRRTYGFHRRDARISYSLFQRESGVSSKSSIANAIYELRYLGIIEREQVGVNMYRYSICYKEGGTPVNRDESKPRSGRGKAGTKP